VVALSAFYVVSNIVFSDTFVEQNPLQHFQVVGSDEDDSSVTRLQLFTGGIKQFMDNPIFGDHIEERSLGFYPHNILIESLMSMGILGGLLIVGIIILSLRAVFVCLKRQGYELAIALLYVQSLVSAMVSGSIYTNSMFWYMSVFVVAVAYMGSVKNMWVCYRV